MEERFTGKFLRLAMAILLLSPAWLFGNEKSTPWQMYQEAANLFRQSGSSEKILDLCKQVTKEAEDPQLRVRAFFLAVQVHVNEKEADKAHKILQNLYDEKKDITGNSAVEARLRDAEIYSQAGDLVSALPLFQMVCDSVSNLFLLQEARLGLAGILAETKQWHQSDSVLNLVIASSPKYKNDERVQALSARQALSLNQPQKAIDLLQGNQSKVSLRLLAEAYEQAGKSIMAVGVYKKLRDLYPGTAEAETALFRAGEVFMRAEDWLAAKNEFEKLVESYPESPKTAHVKYRLGWIYLQLNQFDAALNAFAFNEIKPENAAYFAYMRAECLYRIGQTAPERLQDAFLAFNSLSALHSQSTIAPLAKLRAALILFEKGDETDAMINLRQYLSLYRKDDLAATTVFLLAIHSDAASSSHYFSELIEQYPESYLYDASLTALQERDYAQGLYQEIINRQAHLGHETSTGRSDFWLRAQYLLHGEASYYLKHYSQALSEYQKAESASEDFITQSAKLGKAWCLLQENAIDSARTVFTALRDVLQGSDILKAEYGIATCSFREQKFTEALQAYPTNAEAGDNQEIQAIIAKSHYRSGECFYRLEYYGQAIESWLKLVELYPRDALAPRAQYRAADTYFRANHFSEAEAAYQVVLDRYGKSSYAPESMLQVAQCKYNAGNYQDAIERFKLFIENYPENAKTRDALEGIQLSYYQMGQGAQASEALEKVVQNFPGGMLSADARFRLASSYLEAKDYDKAVVAFKEILTQYPGSTYAMDAQFALADAYQAKGDNEAATQEYQRFIQYFPDSPNIAEAMFNLAVGYFNIESFLSAGDYFKQIVEKFPQSSFYNPALQNLGWCYKRLGENEKALHHFQTYVDKNAAGPDVENMKLQIATLQAEMGQSGKALPVFTALSKSNNDDIAAEAAYQSGMLLLQSENVEAARQAFNMSVKKGARDNYYRLSSLAQLGAIYEGQKSWQKAVAAYKLLADSASDPTWINAAQERMNAISSRVPAE
ncbi:MAG: tetratricopeptide repeat protein [Deferribacteres bacterium]|nr:tetratricopeptide repeat protein [Deferribacteres bacterium]